jgi:hypothetical protein
LNLATLDYAGAVKAIQDGINCPKWASIFRHNLKHEGSNLAWRANLKGLYKNMRKFEPDVAMWS